MDEQRKEEEQKSTCIAQLVSEKCVSKSQASCHWQGSGPSPLGKGGV